MAKNDREARDAAIAEADRLGYGVNEIHRLTGATPAERLAVSQVHGIIMREHARVQADFESRVMQ